MPYGILMPLVDDLEQLWYHFHSGFAVVCTVHSYRISGGAHDTDGNVLAAPDMEKVYELPVRDMERR